MISNTIQKKYFIFLASIFLLIVVSQLVIQYDISQQTEDAILINVSGRQRMLSQRIAKRALYLQNEIQTNQFRKSNIDTLQKLVNEFEKIHQALLYGDKSLKLQLQRSPALDTLLNQTTPLLYIITKACRKLIQSPTIQVVNEAMKILEKNELKFLLIMDKVVDTFVAESRNKINRLRWIEFILALFTVSILISEFLLIFKPLIKKLSITNQSLQQSNTSLARLNQELKAIFDSTQVSITRLDTNGYFTHFNRGAERMLGYKAEEVIGKHTPALIHLPEEIDNLNREVGQKLQKELQGFEALEYVANLPVSPPRQWTYLAKNGSSLQVQLTTSNIKNLQGEVIGYLGVATDISELIRTKQDLIVAKENQEILANKLARQNEQLLSFAHITSHNLRSPVSNLNALLLFYHESEDEAEKEMLFSKFEIVIRHLTETLNELIETLKIQEDTEIEREHIDFETLFLKIKETFAGTLIETKAEVMADFSKLPQIHYPKTYLESILLNLFSNALKYRSPDRIPKIRIQTDKIDGKEILTVSDNGLGIDLSKHGHKLFGLRKTFHKHAEAKGIGLFITKTQIEAMGGSITVESQVDVGTTFKIIFNQST